MENLETNNLERLEKLLIQSTKGCHLLFSNEEISEALTLLNKDMSFYDNSENRGKVQSLILEVLGKTTLKDKVYFLQSLNKDDYHLFVRAYFRLVDNTLLSAIKVKH